MFRVAVAGCNGLTDLAFVSAKLDAVLADRLPDVTVLHLGCDVGRLAAEWAAARGVAVEGLSPAAGEGLWDVARRLVASADAVVAVHPLPRWDATAIAVVSEGTVRGVPAMVYWVERGRDGLVRRVDKAVAYGR